MFKTAINGLKANRLRFALTAVSVVLGVAFVAGSFVFTDTINARFETLFTDVYAGVDATVRPADDAFGAEDGYLDESLLEDVVAVNEVRTAEGYVNGSAQIIDPDGEPIGGQGPPTLGFSWIDDPALNVLRIDDGNGRPPQVTGEVVIDKATAETQSFSLGDEIEVVTMNGMESFTLVGIASFGTEDNLAGATLSAFELSDAQRLFDLEGKLTGIDVIAESGVDQETLVEDLSAVAPAGVEVVSGDQQMQEELDSVTEGLGFLSTALLAFAGVAVFVGAFVIQNTFRITVAQRMRELALFRAVGATARQVTRLVLIEATALAVIASAVGVAAGIGIAELIRVGMNAAGLGLPDGPLTVEPRTVVVAMAVGVVTTVLAALLPARKAAAVPPVAAISGANAGTTQKSLRTRTLVGASLAVVGGGLMTLGLVVESGASLALVAGGAVALFLGLSTLAPLVAAPIAKVLAAPFRGITGKLARENSIRQPRRTASTASALMIGIALVAFVSIFAASIGASVTDTLEQSFPSDLSVSSTNFSVPVSPSAVDQLREVPEFDVASPVSIGNVAIDGTDVSVAGVETGTVARVYDPGASIEMSELGEGLLVHEGLMSSKDWAVGDVVSLEYDSGTAIDTEIVGTFDQQVFANLLISSEVFESNIGDDQIASVFIRVADGVAPVEGQELAEESLADYPHLEVSTKSEQVADAEAQVDQLVALFSGLLGLALVIALLGIANTLALSVVERTKEIGLLRAVGMSRRQVRAMIRFEAIVTALFGALMGVFIGSAIGFGVVSSLADDGLGSFALPASQLLVWLAIAAIAGVVAAMGPARKAARLDVLEAISYE